MQGIKNLVYFDLETRSPHNIKLIGGNAYVASKHTYIMNCHAIVLNLETKRKQTFDYIATEPHTKSVISTLKAIMERPDTITIAHNGDGFDFALMKRAWGIDIKLPVDSIPLMASFYAERSASLEAIAQNIDKNLGKDKLGSKAMLQLACPKGKKYMELDESLGAYLARLGKPDLKSCFLPIVKKKMDESHEYCQKDVQLLERICSMPNAEKDIISILINHKIGKEGIRIDVPFIKLLLKEIDKLKSQISKDIGIPREVLTSTQKFKKAAKEEKLELESCSKEYLLEKLQDSELSDRHKSIIQARLDMNKSSLAKLQKALDVRVEDRLLNQIKMNLTQTGRYSGREFQPHSLPSSKNPWQNLVKLLSGKGLDNIEEAVSLVRLTIVPEEGHKFSVIDYASIEARILVWLVEDHAKIKGYNEGVDFYKNLAAKIYQKPIEDIEKAERTVGKVLVLGCGYQMGEDRLEEQLDAFGAELQGKTPYELLNAFRDEYSLVAGTTVWEAGKPKLYKDKYQVRTGGMWKDMNTAFSNLISGETKEESLYKVYMERIGDDIHLTLPSGRKLYYRNVGVLWYSKDIEEANEGLTQAKRKIAYSKNADGTPNFNITKEEGEELKALNYSPAMTYGINTPIKIYGGKIVENVVQAIGNCILRQALKNIVTRGYAVALHVHDEVITNVKNKEDHDKLMKLMVDMPKWAEGIPLDVEGGIMSRYSKEPEPSGFELAKEIAEYDKEYFKNNESKISDQDYDAKVEKLNSINPELKVMGSDLQEGFDKILHTTKMLSMEKVFNFTKLKKRLKKINIENSFIIEPKIDGVAVELRYLKGVYDLALTRGDGKEGDCITEQVRSYVPQTIPTRFDEIHIRGEFYINTETFKKKYSKDYKNARNFVAGSLKQLDPSITASRDLSFMSYDIGYIDDNKRLEMSFTDSYIKLLKYGFKTPAFQICNVDNVMSKIDILENATLEYATDGVVIKNDAPEAAMFGKSSKYFADRFAYKFDTEKAISEVLGVTFKVGRTGNITPVAQITPVELTGSTISKVTVHNLDRLRELNLKVGDVIEIKKAGEIIPAICRVVTSIEGMCMFPAYCPSCKELLDYGSCKNEKCGVKIIAGIDNFCKVMKIQGLGSKVIEGLGLTSISDVYRISEKNADDKVGKSRIGLRKIKKLIVEIKNSYGRPLWQFIAAFGVPSISKTTAEDIFKGLDLTNYRDNSLTGAKEDSFKAFDFTELEKIFVFCKETPCN